MADAARLLPLAGAALMLLPLLHLVGDGSSGGATDAGAYNAVDASDDDAATGGTRTSQVGLYIFAVWVGLMLIAFGLSRGLRDVPLGDEDFGITRRPEDIEA